MARLPPLAYFICNAIEGSVITPLTLGRRLELNPVAILIALAFGGWMWGIVGALIGVPLLVVVKVFCDHFDGLANFGEFLSGEPTVRSPCRTPPSGPSTAGRAKRVAGGVGSSADAPVGVSRSPASTDSRPTTSARAAVLNGLSTTVTAFSSSGMPWSYPVRKASGMPARDDLVGKFEGAAVGKHDVEEHQAGVGRTASRVPRLGDAAREPNGHPLLGESILDVEGDQRFVLDHEDGHGLWLDFHDRRRLRDGAVMAHYGTCLSGSAFNYDMVRGRASHRERRPPRRGGIGGA